MSEDWASENTEALMDLTAMAAEELHPDLLPWVEEGQWGPMLRHPLVYQIPLSLPGMANKALTHKRKELAEAIEAEDWSRVIWLHERPYRLNALIEYVLGTYPDGVPMPLEYQPQHSDLVADVWVDSENIQQEIDKWRQIINGDAGVPYNFWLGTADERREFDALPNSIPAWRGGAVGDWSWTTNPAIAEFFSRRSGLPVRHAFIPKADCFGYLTRRNEDELLVRLTPERYALVYPEGE